MTLDGEPRVPRRDPQAEEQIAGARAEPEDRDPEMPDSITLIGPAADAYRKLQEAAKTALRAQKASALAGSELREAFNALCIVIAPESEGR